METQPKPRIELYVLSGLLLFAGTALLFFRQPFWWFGSGLLSASIGLLYKLLSSNGFLQAKLRENDDLVSFTAEWFCVALLGTVTITLIPEILTGLRPINHDHSVHFAKAWQLKKSFLMQGKLWGWSHQWFAGYPAQYLYPFGGDLWVVLLQWLSFGFLRMEQAYAVGFALHWVLLGYALFACARQSFSRTVSILAALLFITDIGSYRLGGWVFAGRWGVWPMNLSLAFGLLAISRIKRVLDGEQWSDVALFGLWIGLGLLTHPLQLIHLGILVPIALVARWFVQGSSRWIVASGRLLLGSLIGLAIGGLWLFPFLASKSFSYSYGALWRDTFRMGVGFYNLDLLPGTWGVVAGLGLLGLLGMLFSRKFYPLFFALSAFVLLLTSSSTFVESFHLTEFSKTFQNLQFQRFAVLLKPYFFIAATYTFLQALKHIAALFATQQKEETKSNIWSTLGRLALVGFLLAPIVYPFAVHYHKRHIRHIFRKGLNDGLKTLKDDPFYQSRKAFIFWAKKEFPKVRGFFRVALNIGKHDHRFFDIGTQLKVPLYKTGFTPATSYRYKMEDPSPQMMRALNVLYVLSKWRLSQRHYTLVRRFGSLYLYKFKRWNPNPFEVIEGKGELKLLSFDDESIVIQAAPGSKGTLRLNVSYFSRWRVTHDGHNLTIRLAKVKNNPKTGFMSVVLKPGVYKFRFRRGWVEFASLFLFCFSLGFCMFLGVLDRYSNSQLAKQIQGGLAQVQAWEGRHSTLIQYALVLGVVVALGFALGLAIWQPPKGYQHPYLLRKPHRIVVDFREKLAKARAWKRHRNRRVGCSYAQGRFQCGPKNWQHIRIKQVRLDTSRWQRCIWMHPQPRHTIQLEYPKIKAGNVLLGYFAIAKSGITRGYNPVTFSVWVNGKQRYTGQTKRDGTRHHFHVELPAVLHKKPIDVSFQVKARRTGRRHFCFMAQGVQIQNP